MRVRVEVLIAYAFFAVITFGHAFVTVQTEFRKDCERKAEKICWGTDAALLVATGSAVFWPLYASIQFSRHVLDKSVKEEG